MAQHRPRRRAKTHKVAFTNQKGGTGKSTTALFVAAAAAELGARVCVRDLDPQFNVTIALAPTNVVYTMNDVMRPDEVSGEVVEGCLASAIRPAGDAWPRGLYVVPSSLALTDREHDQAVGREYRLRTVSAGALDGFDLVVDDCPPSVGQLTVNALVDDDSVVIVTIPEQWPVQGTHQAYRTIQRVKKFYNPQLEFLGVQVNAYKTNRAEPAIRVKELETAYPGMLLPMLADIEVIRKAIGANSPLTAYGAEGRTAADHFRAFAERLLND
jgi:chromosome partitioning protein